MRELSVPVTLVLICVLLGGTVRFVSAGQAAEHSPEAAKAAEPHAGPEVAAKERHGESGHGGEHIGAEGVSEDPMKPRADLAVYTFVVFLVLLAVLWKFAWGPIRDALDQRERTIAEQIEEARRSNEQARELLAQYERKLADAQGEVEAMMARAKREAETIKDGIVREAQREADRMRQSAERQIERAKQQALRELFDQAAALATELAGRIVRRSLRPEDQKDLVEETIRELASRN